MFCVSSITPSIKTKIDFLLSALQAKALSAAWPVCQAKRLILAREMV
jgi:hypothetical protein